MSHEGIEEVVVLLKGEEESDKYLVGYYVSDKELVVSDLRAHLLELLPEYMVPTYYVHMDSIPLTVSGKVDRKALPTPEIVAGEDYQSPSNEIEEKLVAIWSEILGLEEEVISVTRSFFELGGNSFRINELGSRLSDSFDMKISLVEIFKRTTIKSISEYISGLVKTKAQIKEESIVLIKNSGVTDNLFMIHDVSGDINGYIRLSESLEAYNCWGIQSALLQGFCPKKLTIKELAFKYIKKIKQIQKEGPYNLLGWSLGGIVAYEIARQMEHYGDRVSQLFMIDSKIPSFDNSELFSFSLEQEKKLLTTFLKEDKIKLDEITSIEELWQKCKPIFTQEMNKEVIEVLPEYFTPLIPDIHKIQTEPLIAKINTIRSLYRALINFEMKDTVQVQLTYIKADSSNTNSEEFSEYFKEEVVSHTVQGDHFSILRENEVLQIQDLINKSKKTNNNKY